MAATEGAMTTLSSSQTEFLPAIEQSENNRINFRDSLKFFQEQLVINGANFPSPSPGCQSGNNTLKKIGSFSFKENNLDKSRVTKDNDIFKEEVESLTSCKIAIPTVDTILESVRVLRAIQKSQEERGSFWNLDVSTKSDTDSYFHYSDEEIQMSKDIQNDHQELQKERIDETDSILVEKLAQDILINQDIEEIKNKTSQLDTNIKDVESTYNSKTSENVCSFWPSNTLVISNNAETENEIKEPLLCSEIEYQNTNHESYKTGRESIESICATELNIKNDSTFEENLNNNSLTDQLEQNDIIENMSKMYSKNEPKIKQISHSENRQNVSESLVKLEQNNQNENPLDASEENLSKLMNESCDDKNIFCEKLSSQCENLLEISTKNISNSDDSLKNVSNSDENQNYENLCQREQNAICENLSNKFTLMNDSGFDSGKNYNKISSQIEQNDNQENSSPENKIEITNTITEICNAPESLNKVCSDLDFMNFSQDDTSQEILLNELNTKSELLKIETYENTDSHKSDVFMLNESLWKDNCSPNDQSSIKAEHNDSDSGFGTQRSGSSLSPNNHSQMQKDSWSDSCSSHYASAECSPYHSLNSVFDSSLGLSATGDAKATEQISILSDLDSTTLEATSEKEQDLEKTISCNEQECNSISQQTINSTDKSEKDKLIEFTDLDFESGNAELDTEISYCNFVTNYTIENPCKRTEDNFQTAQQTIEIICDSSENITEKINDQETDLSVIKAAETNNNESVPVVNIKGNEQDNSYDLSQTQKFTAASCDLISIVQSLYTIKENPAYQILPALDEHKEKFEEELFVLSKGAFYEFPEDYYLILIENSNLYIKKDSQVLCELNLKYGEVSIWEKTILEIDNKMGKSIYIKSDTNDLTHLKIRMEANILNHWQRDCLQLVHYPLKYHQNVVIIDLGSCSTRAGILMDQPTLPSLFFPTICATNKTLGTNVYGIEAFHSEVRQHSNLSFPVRPTNKITKHTIDINLLEGLFKKIFCNLKVEPSEYTIQVCLPRNLSINAQTALMKLLLEDLKVKAISLTNQALLTLYAHEVSTAIVVDIGDRIDVLPVVDGFIVENGVTKLPHGGQRLIHHMKHGLAEKRISLSSDIDSFVVQYIIENLAYVAEDYEKEMQIASQNPERIKKTVTLQSSSLSEKISYKAITLEEARFKIPEGLFNPDLWGLDSPGIHHLVQKAIQATGVDARKQIAENIYISGGVTMLPGFVERLSKEITKLSKTKIIPKVHASNYRYHSTYIGACKFAKMNVFPQVCVNLDDYSRNGPSVLKKCALCF